MTRDPSPAALRFQKRLLKGFFIVLLSYPICLLLVGPYWALEGRGALNCIPEGIRSVGYLPMGLVWLIPHARGRYQDYLDWWYLDPNAADRETGWD